MIWALVTWNFQIKYFKQSYIKFELIWQWEKIVNGFNTIILQPHSIVLDSYLLREVIINVLIRLRIFSIVSLRSNNQISDYNTLWLLSLRCCY